ncbi:MAG TPA: hypothetical protein VMF31_04040 [Solirubrobacterales bacterium]|nr:hypothetical protein [Solirubrobacterales bacterium]
MKTIAERHQSLLIRVTLAFAALSTALVPLQQNGTLGLAISLGLSLLIRTAYSGMAAALVCLPGQRDTAGELWAEVRGVLSTLIWVTLLVAVLAGFGFVLLVIPCLIMLTIWSVVVPVVVVERTGVFESLSRSRELVRGNGWRVFGFLVCLFLITVAFALLGLIVARPFGSDLLGVMVGNFVLICIAFPILLGGPAALYNALAGPPESRRTQAEEDPPESLTAE